MRYRRVILFYIWWFIFSALMSLMGYMQCQPAPPPLLNLFPQPCNRTIECLPNLCCQEGSGKFCRPAKKSVLSLVAQATQVIRWRSGFSSVQITEQNLTYKLIKQFLVVFKQISIVSFSFFILQRFTRGWRLSRNIGIKKRKKSINQ